jgi:hypothetical protein
MVIAPNTFANTRRAGSHDPTAGRRIEALPDAGGRPTWHGGNAMEHLREILYDLRSTAHLAVERFNAGQDFAGWVDEFKAAEKAFCQADLAALTSDARPLVGAVAELLNLVETATLWAERRNRPRLTLPQTAVGTIEAAENLARGLTRREATAAATAQPKNGPRPRPNTQGAKIVELLNCGLDRDAITKRVGCDVDYVSTIKKRYAHLISEKTDTRKVSGSVSKKSRSGKTRSKPTK